MKILSKVKLFGNPRKYVNVSYFLPKQNHLKASQTTFSNLHIVTFDKRFHNFPRTPPFAARCICLPLHIIMHYAKSTHLPAHLHYKTHSTLSIDAKLDFYICYFTMPCRWLVCVKNVRALSLYCALYIWCTSTLSSTKTSWLNPQNISKTEVALSSELCLSWWVRTGASSGSWFAVCLQ